MPFGAQRRPDGSVRFRLWAPGHSAIVLEIGAPVAGRTREFAAARAVTMKAVAGGWHEQVVDGVPPSALYRFRLESGLSVPDPASRSNPFDVHGPSALVDPLAYRWGDTGWRGRPWHEAVVYELHVGAFTPQGSFNAVRERLPGLAALGITAIELMPVADFPGARNWGYDGVLPFAPDASYGTPEDLKALVERAHQLGLMVLLDVVYNHFGPEGNYLHAYAAPFFDATRHTPWGAAIAFDGPSSRVVRDFFVHNALYWVEEFRFDGLRLDAVHAIDDRSAPDIVTEIAQALREGPGRERHVHLVLENDRNQASYLARDRQSRPLHASAQWNDDVHHALHVLLTDQRDGYYADYADAPLERLGRGLAEGFVYQGEPSRFRGGERRGEASAHLPPQAFVDFLQTHDQVGNRAFGERMEALADPRSMPAALACLLLAPAVPMLFMGEEWGASTPFLFFCDFGPELAAAVSRGRREEFGRFEAFRDPAARERIPDPNAQGSFAASRLDWSERDRSPHLEREALVRDLLAIRARVLVPRLARMSGGGEYRVDGELLTLRWTLGDGATLVHQLRVGGCSGSAARGPGPASRGPGPAVEAPAAQGECLFELGVRRGADGRLRFDPGSIRVSLLESVID
jgi:maltooligosyltrehalose trehalohydrolase